MLNQHFRLSVLTLALFASGSLSSAVADTAMATAGHVEVTMSEQLAKASTPADHKAMAQRFDEEASQLDKQAAEHEQLATQYKQHPNPNALKSAGVNTTVMAEHCDRIAKSLKASASEAREMASLHRNVANNNAN